MIKITPTTGCAFVAEQHGNPTHVYALNALYGDSCYSVYNCKSLETSYAPTDCYGHRLDVTNTLGLAVCINAGWEPTFGLLHKKRCTLTVRDIDYMPMGVYTALSSYNACKHDNTLCTYIHDNGVIFNKDYALIRGRSRVTCTNLHTLASRSYPMAKAPQLVGELLETGLPALKGGVCTKLTKKQYEKLVQLIEEG